MTKELTKRWLQKYRYLIEGKPRQATAAIPSEIDRWKDELFINFLIYCFPVSLFAVIPGVLMAIRDGYLLIAVIDLACLALLLGVTFLNRLSLYQRKLVIMGMFYILAVFLIAELGYIGPGVFYLLAITLLCALILPFRFAYWSIGVNAALLGGFSVVIYTHAFPGPLVNEYTAGQWLAFSSNLVFISIVVVSLIQRIFNGLQETISHKNNLQEKYQSIFEHSPLPMWLFDVHTLQFLDVNLAAVSHYGYTRAEFLNMTIRDIRPLEHRDRVKDLVRANKDRAKVRQDLMVHVLKDGTEIQVKIETSLMDFNGVRAKLVLVTDITSQCKAELEIRQSNLKVRESESSLRAIFDSSIDGFLLLDANCIIKAFNLKAKESILFNRDEAEFEAGRSIYNYLNTARRAYFQKSAARVLSGEIIAYDVKYLRRGQTVWIHYTLSPVCEDGEFTGICISGRDISAFKRYVETIENQNRAFREISWIQSHNVRAPLARIMGLLPLLNGAGSPEEQEMITGYLQVSCEELDGVIKEITDKTSEISHASSRDTVFLN